MIKTILTRRGLVSAAAAGVTFGAPFARLAQATPVTIRYATGGGTGTSEIEVMIYQEWMQKNVLQAYGNAYTVDMTFTRGTPEAATLLAAGHAAIAPLSPPVFATALLKNILPNGMTIISDNFQDGRPGGAVAGVVGN